MISVRWEGETVIITFSQEVVENKATSNLVVTGETSSLLCGAVHDGANHDCARRLTRCLWLSTWDDLAALTEVLGSTIIIFPARTKTTICR